MYEKTETVTFRISFNLMKRIGEEARFGPFPLSMDDFLTRGIELALDELSDLRNGGQR